MTRNKSRPHTSKVKYGLRWIFIFVVVCGICYGPQVATIWEMKQELKAMSQAKEQLIEKNLDFQARTQEMQSDEMLEKLAREELGMIKPGEKVLVKVIPQD